MRCFFVLLRPVWMRRLFAFSAAALMLSGCGGGGGSDAGEPLPPVGGRIVFASNRTGDYEIYAMDADGSRQTRLTADPAPDVTPALSPDGTKIVFVSGRNGSADIYVMDANGSNLTRLTQGPDPSRSPAFSPDGGRIVFVRYEGGDYPIFVMNADGSGLTRVTTERGYREDPVFSPDGSKIALDASLNNSGRQVFLMNADGSGLLQLTGLPAGPAGGATTRLLPPEAITGDPAFSPDGSKIVFASDHEGDDGGGQHIYVMNVDGSDIRRLTNPGSGLPTSYRKPSFSADGRTIVFQAYVRSFTDQEIGVMNADGSGLTLLTRNPASDQHPSMR